MTWLQVVLTALATYRLAILVTRDTFPFGPLRTWLARHYTGSFIELIHCVWCISMWIGLVAVLLTAYEWSWWRWVCLVLTASAVSGFLGEHS